jgi:hypothetical protein
MFGKQVLHKIDINEYSVTEALFLYPGVFPVNLKNTKTFWIISLDLAIIWFSKAKSTH